jgi:hypothetical protein
MGPGTDRAAPAGESQRYAQLAGSGATAAPAKRGGQRAGQRCARPALRRRPDSRAAPATGNILARNETLWPKSPPNQAPPPTAPETEARLERKTGWIRSLFAQVRPKPKPDPPPNDC